MVRSKTCKLNQNKQAQPRIATNRVLAPLDDQRRAAEFALFVRRLLHTLDVFHVLLGVSGSLENRW